MPFHLDGQPATLDAIHARFPAYGKHSVRDGLRAGYVTAATLLAYLADREVKALRVQGGRNKNSMPPLVYSRKSRGV